PMPVNSNCRGPDPSITVTLEIGSKVGGSFTLWTVKRKLSETFVVPSLKFSVIRVEPNALGTGASVTTRLLPLPPYVIPEGATMLGSADTAVSVSESADVSTSPIVTGTANGVSSGVTWSSTWTGTGGSFTGVSVRAKAPLALALFASVTVRVIVTVPLRLVAGVTVSVRLVPAPARASPASATRFVSDEVTVTCRLAAGVSTSEMTNVTGPNGVSSSVDASGRSEIVGGSLTGRTVTCSVRVTTLLELPPSSAVTVRVTTPLALVAGVKLRVPTGSPSA